jgi:hypothetical protein
MCNINYTSIVRLLKSETSREYDGETNDTYRLYFYFVWVNLLEKLKDGGVNTATTRCTRRFARAEVGCNALMDVSNGGY